MLGRAVCGGACCLELSLAALAAAAAAAAGGGGGGATAERDDGDSAPPPIATLHRAIVGGTGDAAASVATSIRIAAAAAAEAAGDSVAIVTPAVHCSLTATVAATLAALPRLLILRVDVAVPLGIAVRRDGAALPGATATADVASANDAEEDDVGGERPSAARRADADAAAGASPLQRLAAAALGLPASLGAPTARGGIAAGFAAIVGPSAWHSIATGGDPPSLVPVTAEPAPWARHLLRLAAPEPATKLLAAIDAEATALLGTFHCEAGFEGVIVVKIHHAIDGWLDGFLRHFTAGADGNAGGGAGASSSSLGATPPPAQLAAPVRASLFGGGGHTGLSSLSVLRRDSAAVGIAGGATGLSVEMGSRFSAAAGSRGGDETPGGGGGVAASRRLLGREEQHRRVLRSPGSSAGAGGAPATPCARGGGGGGGGGSSPGTEAGRRTAAWPDGAASSSSAPGGGPAAAARAATADEVDALVVAVHTAAVAALLPLLWPHWAAVMRPADRRLRYRCTVLAGRVPSPAGFGFPFPADDADVAALHAATAPLVAALDAPRSPLGAMRVAHALLSRVAAFATDAQRKQALRPGLATTAARSGDADGVTADACLPAVVFALAHARPRRLASAVAFAASFRHETLDCSALGYAATTLEAAVRQLDVEYDRRAAAPLLSP